MRGLKLIMWSEGQWEVLKFNGETDRHTDTHTDRNWNASTWPAPLWSGNKYNLKLPKCGQQHGMLIFSKTVTSIFELDEGWLSSNIRAVALKMNESLKKQTWLPASFLLSKTTFWSGSPVYVEIWSASRKGRSNLPTNRPQTRSAPEGRPINYDDDDGDDDDNIHLCSTYLKIRH